MAGRHSLNAPSATFFSKGRTGFLTATAAGAVVGLGMPVANANPEDAQATASVRSVAIETAALDAASTQARTVEVPAISGGDWKVADVELVVEEPVVIEEPVAEVATDSVSDQTEQEPAQAAATPAQSAQAQASQEATPAQAAAPTQAAAPAPVAVSGGNSNVVAIARQYSGAPYVSGGTTPAGWDCSGFTSYVFAQAGIALPRTSGAQLNAGYRVSASQAQPGDLVWWPGHVGIYTGNGQHIAARNPSAGTYEGPVYGSPVYVRVG